jgi:DNA-binding IclR family transcriptional regulator
VHALAVPLRDMQGGTVATINVVSSSLLGAGLLGMLPLLLDAAR